MPGTPTLQKGSVDGLESWRELIGWFAPRVVITRVPLESQTVNWTFALDVAFATAPQPTLISANCRPEAPGCSVSEFENVSDALTGRGVAQLGGRGVM